MSNLENTKFLEAQMEKSLEEMESNFKKLGEVLNKIVDTALDTQDAFRKIKMVDVELKDFQDKVSAYAGNMGVYIPRSKGLDEFYTPPTESTGDVDYLKKGMVGELSDVVMDNTPIGDIKI